MMWETDGHTALGLRWITALLQHQMDEASVSAETVADYYLAMVEAESQIDDPLMGISTAFDLSRFERQIILLCVVVEFDASLMSIITRLQPHLNQMYPTWYLALRLLPESSSQALSPEQPLRYWKLIEINQTQHQPLMHSTIRLDERILNAMQGVNYLDDRLTMLLRPITEPTVKLAPSQLPVYETLLRQLTRSSGWQHLPVIQMIGTSSTSKQIVAWTLSQVLERDMYRLAPDMLPRRIEDIEIFCRLWQREHQMQPIILFINVRELHTIGERTHEVELLIRLLIERTDCITFLDVDEYWSGIARPTLNVNVDKPNRQEQQQFWVTNVNAMPDAIAPLAEHFNFDLPQIQEIATTALAACDDRDTLVNELWQTSKTHVRPRMGSLAQQVAVHATWDDLILPDESMQMLYQIIAQVEQRNRVYDDWGLRQQMNRGLGISVLFAGQSGTGKTMAAEVIANRLGFDLYRIDLSSIVSKYIGDTEKNLRQVFDAAEEGGCILFFDEADAVFWQAQ
jgi:hypothetical protein